MDAPILYIVIPCYNEEKVLPVTHAIFADKLSALIQNGEISEKSRVLFVDDAVKTILGRSFRICARKIRSLRG